MRQLGIALLAGLLLASCTPGAVTIQPPRLPQPRVTIDAESLARRAIYQRWAGHTFTGAGSREMELEITRGEGGFYGEYKILRGALGQGIIEGTIEEGIVTALIRVRNNCIYDFTGTITEDRLEGEGVPTRCPRGERFTWLLRPS